MSAEALREILAFSSFTLLTLLGFTTYWLRMRARQFKGDLEKKLERLERASVENAQRIEDLETIIVSQAGKTLQDPAVARPHEVQSADREAVDRQRAAELARRLRG